MASKSLTGSLLLLVTWCQLLLFAAAGDVGESCTTPDSLAGICTPLPNCKPLMALLPKIRNKTTLTYLKNCHCGPFVGLDPVVCCANANANANANAKANAKAKTTSSPLSTAIISNALPARGGGFEDDFEDEDGDDVDVSTHPNIGLINGDQCGESFASKIFGGVEAEMHEFPWMALLKYRSKRNTDTFNCGGTLINKRYVLTAAHCVVGTGKVGTLAGVRLGEHDTRNATDCQETYFGEECSPPPQDLDIEAVIPHPSYNRSRLVNDIALLRLKADVNLGTEQVQTVCLPVGSDLQFGEVGGVNLTVAGWGMIENKTLSSVLMKTRVPGMAFKACADTYRPHNVTIVRSQVCAGGSSLRQDSCKGDSGGPLKMFVGSRAYQVGVVSYGTSKCATVGFPGVYTRVGRYMKWILDNIKP